MLLPKSELDKDTEEDPRAELVRKLQEYERFKQLAEQLDEIPRQERDIFGASLKTYDISFEKLEANVSMQELTKAFEKILRRAKVSKHHLIQHEPISVREKMVSILSAANENEFCEFTKLFNISEGKIGVVVTFIALLELIKQNLLQLIQSEPFQEIHIKKKSKV